MNRTTSTTPEVLGQGPTLVMVPGLDGTAQLFYRQLPQLSQKFEVVTFPLPDDRTCTMDSLVGELRELTDRYSPDEPVLLCGESFGGALSLSFALAQGERLRGLVILNSFPVIRQRWRLRLAPWALSAIPWGAMRIVRRFTESRLHSAHARREDLKEFHERTRAIRKQGYLRRLEILQSYDIRDRLGEISTPTLFLAADQDRLLQSVREAEYMTERMPNAVMRVLEGFGHICMINHDFDLLGYIEPWLSQTTVRR